MGSDISIAVLCGGESVRFGSNKAVHEFGGKPLYKHVLDKVSGLSDDVFLQVGRRNPSLKGRVNEDAFPDTGPLGGILSALEYALHERVFVVACDMLFLDARILDELASAGFADIVVPRWRDGKTEPLCAVYSKNISQIARKLLERGHQRVSGLFTRVGRTVYVDIEPLMEQGRIRKDCFVNINVPSDLPRSN